MGRAIALIATIILGCLSCHKPSPPLFESISSNESGIDFNNIVEENDSMNILLAQYMYNGGGVGVGDFNNDGLADLYFTGNLVDNKLYLNRGDFRFEDITEQAGVAAPGIWSAGVSLVDINNDGKKDIYINATFHEDSLMRRNQLFINEGLDKNGIPTFSEQAAKFGIDDTGHSTHSAFFDYDRDGDLDLYVLTNVLILKRTNKLSNKITDGSSVTTDRLYRNNGDGSFSNVSAAAGITIEGFGLGINVLDVNQDGYADLYISNDFIMNDVLYINQKDGTFRNEIDQYFKHQSYSSMGSDAADINNDGLTDIMTLDMLPESNQRVKQMFASNNYNFHELVERRNYQQQYMRNCVQLNNGNQRFSDISQMLGMAGTDWSWSILFADYDNDGWRDAFITNGFPRDITDHDFSDFRAGAQSMAYKDNELLEFIPIVKIRNYLFHNQGDLNFKEVSEDWGLQQSSFSNGAAFADLDNDGDLDFIINNINDPAFLYQNHLSEQEKVNHFLKIKLEGAPSNRDGLGAKIWLEYADGVKYYEHTLYRGYLSSVDPTIHFGMGAISQIERIKIHWPDGKKQVLKSVVCNQTLSIEYKNAQETIAENNAPKTKSLFQETNALLSPPFVHTDRKFQDFRIQILLPRIHSEDGPGLAVGDVNGDGKEDFFVGNGRKKSGAFYWQSDSLHFIAAPFRDTSDTEDHGVLLFDADGDNDLDLYVVSGSSEFRAGAWQYRDRLFLNDGKGVFTLDESALPDLNMAGSLVTAADFDADGDLDLFIGGRLQPQSYPLPERSAILRNDGGKFIDVTAELCPELLTLGMVSTALWTDFNQDQKIDLLLAGEWMPITALENTGTGFKNVSSQRGLDKTEGWWNSIVAADFDQDGDLDYVLGNQGLNNKFVASKEKPLKVFAKDFDKNGSVDHVISAFSENAYHPIHLKNDLVKQLNVMRKKFPKFADFGVATTDDLFNAEELSDAYQARACVLESIYLENTGDRFLWKALPRKAQVAPVKGMLTDDYNQDGFSDILLVGNEYGTEVFNGRHDAFTGLLLAGDGQGDFQAMPQNQSGFNVDGNAKALVQLYQANGQPLIIAAENRQPLKTFQAPHANHYRLVQPKTDEYRATLYHQDGSQSIHECYYGSGYLSASSRNFRVDTGRVKKVILLNYLGEERGVSF